MTTTEAIGIIGAVTTLLTALTGVLVAIRNLRNGNGNHNGTPAEIDDNPPVNAPVKVSSASQ